MSRRQMFAGAGVAVSALALASTALPATSSTGTRQTGNAIWDRAMAALKVAERDERNFDREVYHVVRDELDRVAPRPDLRFRVGSANGTFASYYFDINNVDEWNDNPIGPIRVAALKVKSDWLAHVAAKERLKVDEAAEESERLQDLVWNLESELIEMPAPDRQALLWKLERLFGPESGRDEGESSASWNADWIDAVMLDARRFLA